MADVVFKSSRVVTPTGVVPATVHVKRGVIERVGAFDEVGDGAPLVDVGDKVISPGVVDSHVHVNEPGRTEWEGFATATRAAARGGVTTIVDMPLNSIPPTTTAQHLAVKRMSAEGKCWIDVGFWGGCIPGNDKELVKMLDAGALGFKCFMVESGVLEFPYVGEKELRLAMGALRETGAPLLCHAELPGPIDAAKADVAKQDPRKYLTYARSRPPEAEEQAIALLVDLCREIEARVHVVHLGAASAAPLIERARDEGLPFSAETTPHYLHFSLEEIPDGATAYKCAPPIRERANREALWQSLDRGVVDLVVSDHSPCAPALKTIETGDFQAAWGGIAGLQLSLPVVWTEARKRGKTLVDLARWMSMNPAYLAGLSHKGAIAAGKDADLVVWDPDQVFKVSEENIEHRHKLTPYAGEELSGVVHATYLRGARVYGDGTIHGSATGRFLERR